MNVIFLRALWCFQQLWALGFFFDIVLLLPNHHVYFNWSFWCVGAIFADCFPCCCFCPGFSSWKQERSSELIGWKGAHCKTVCHIKYYFSFFLLILAWAFSLLSFSTTFLFTPSLSLVVSLSLSLSLSLSFSLSLSLSLSLSVSLCLSLSVCPSLLLFLPFSLPPTTPPSLFHCHCLASSLLCLLAHTTRPPSPLPPPLI